MALEGLGEKLKSFFKPKEDARFKGQGRRLGTPEVPSSSDGAPAVNRPPGYDAGAERPVVATTPLKPPPQPLRPGGRSALVVSRSHHTEDVVLDAAVMANTPTGKEVHLVAAFKPPGATTSHLGPGSLPAHTSPTQGASTSNAAFGATDGDGLMNGLTNVRFNVAHGSRAGGGELGSSGGHALGASDQRKAPHSRMGINHLNTMVSTISTPTAAEKRLGGFRCPVPPTDGAMADYGLASATSHAYELQRCLALVLSSGPVFTSNLSTSSSISMPAATPIFQPPAGGTGASSSPSASELPSSCRTISTDPDGKAPSTIEDAATHSYQNLLATSSLSSKSLSATSPSASAVAPPGAEVGEMSAGAHGGGGDSSKVVAMEGGGAGRGSADPRECCDALLRVLRNVMTRPEEPKFRQIRLSNPRVQATIVGVPGAVEFLEAAGFQMQFSPDDGTEMANQGFLVLPDGIARTSLAEPFRLLSEVMAAHGFNGSTTAGLTSTTTVTTTSTTVAHSTTVTQQSSQPQPQAQGHKESRLGLTAAEVAVPAVERCTQVILPVAPDVQVPDWFFARTGAEVREQWVAMLRRREEAERFMTRTMKDVRRQQEAAGAAAGTDGGWGPGGGAQANVATVRVRFPEGVCLQGHFGAIEPVSRVFEWVAAALRSEALTFELIKPDRRPLETVTTAAAAAAACRKTTSSTLSAVGRAATVATVGLGRPGDVAKPLTVRAADMLPSILLNLRPMGEQAAALTSANLPLLSDEMLRSTRPQ